MDDIVVTEPERQEWRARIKGLNEPWYGLEVAFDCNGKPERDKWAVVAGEAFVVGMAEEFEMQDGDLIEIELMAPDSRIYVLKFLMKASWEAELYSARES